MRLARAEGKQAEVVNAQAEAAEQTLKTEADIARAYRAELDQALRQGALSVDQTVRAYAHLRRFTEADINALSGHCRGDRKCSRLLRKGIDAHEVWERAKTRPWRRRSAYGEAMVRTVREQHAWERIEHDPKPAVWKPKTRRQWAELRRHQRARLDEARQAERLAARATSETAMRRYAAAELQALQGMKDIEIQRREKYPVPSDRRWSPKPRPVPKTERGVSPVVPPPPKPEPEHQRRPRP